MAKPFSFELIASTSNVLQSIQFNKPFVETIESYKPALYQIAKYGINHYYLNIKDFQKHLLTNFSSTIELPKSLTEIHYSPCNSNYSVSNNTPFDNALLSDLVEQYVKSVWGLHVSRDDLNLIISWPINFATLKLTRQFIEDVKQK